MNIPELIKKLKEKPQQKEEVQFVVWTKDGGNIVCCDIGGPMVKDLMKVFAKHAPEDKP